ncbi:MAG: ATP-binding protein [Patescibacteria group bacterium]
MDSSIHLIVHNVAAIISSVMLIGLALFLVINNPRSRSTIIFSLMLVAVLVFIVSHVIGVNIVDPNLSRVVFMFNLSIFFIGVFIFHSIIATIGKEKERKLILIAIYVASILITVFFVFNPDLFLLPSISKMYFPNYYVPGVLNWLRLVFLYGLMVPYSLLELFLAYRQSQNNIERQQLKYFIIAIFVGFSFGFIPNFLVYNIPVDPLWGILLVSLFVIPIVYGSVRYRLFNIKIIATQAFFYSLAIGIVGGFISLLNYSNQWISVFFPNFPIWITALISAFFAVTISVFAWRKLRESDLLKYEFVTTVTHKFRTPLTHIKWASENLSKSALSTDDQTQVKYIQSADEKLVELTRLLMNISETESSGYEYKMVRSDLSALVIEVEKGMREQYLIKNMTVTEKIEPALYAEFDQSRIKFIVQTFIENAIRYTREGGTILISLTSRGHDVVFSVKDTGVGIAKDELSLIFSKFYRSKEARQVDTEGMGIGLYVSKEIISRHNGKIWAESDGSGKGSTFSFLLPVIK